ncbi:DUF2927 domain-containing protein [Parasalinivibrio latis]|uniref:DUF2927 domain-containing protein n=1 Tax=Parasalinivibrio latis TaxID=2952610 RepID=UPI0030DEDC43
MRISASFFAALLGISALFNPISVSAVTQPWQNPAFILNAFHQIALKNEYSPGEQKVRKWTHPVSVWIEHKVGDRQLHNELVTLHLQHLSALTGLQFTKAASEQSANLSILFTRQSTWFRDAQKLFRTKDTSFLNGAVCAAHFATNGRGSLTKAAVVIPVDQARMHGKLVACVVEEITQTMGLPNDSEQVYPSIFNDRTPEDLLSGLDSILIRMLYQPDIKPGQSWNMVKPKLEQTLKTWQKDGTLARANAEIRRGGLYKLMGL